MSGDYRPQQSLFDSENDWLGTNESVGVEVTEESGRWRARDITYVAGKWESICRFIPRFTTEDFSASPDDPPNPYLRSVVRQPQASFERPIPVGVVSNSYRLAQHTDVIEKCFEGLRNQGIDPNSLRCEAGLSPLGEWMNFRAYFPERELFTPQDKNKLDLRLECFNSVDGSSRLVILLGWFRLVCSNGLVIGETRADIRDIHDSYLNVEAIPGIIAQAIAKIDAEIERLRDWEGAPLDIQLLTQWIDTELASAWGKKAACRVLHICCTGMDVEFPDPFAPGKASEKPAKPTMVVPGAYKPSRNLYDLCQALSWVATRRANLEERLEWQAQISNLIESHKKELTSGRPFQQESLPQE